jgi:hypothetical protein
MNAPEKPEANDRLKTGGLYVGWDELHELVAPRIGRDRFRALIKLKVLHAGFPPFRDEWEGFYRPAVKAWLDNDNGVATHGPVAGDVQDGPENFDAAPRKKAGLQNRSSRPSVLVRETGNPRPQGVPRHLHSVASGGD